MPLNTSSTYHPPPPPPLVAIFFCQHTYRQMFSAMSHFKPYMLGPGCPPRLRLARDPPDPPPPPPAPWNWLESGRESAYGPMVRPPPPPGAGARGVDSHVHRQLSKADEVVDAAALWGVGGG